jgi:hypothetical protein
MERRLLRTGHAKLVETLLYAFARSSESRRLQLIPVDDELPRIFGGETPRQSGVGVAHMEFE